MFIVGTAQNPITFKHADDSSCDVVEVRWDKFHLSVEEMVKCKKPILLTYRAESDGWVNTVPVSVRAEQIKSHLPYVKMIDVDVIESYWKEMESLIEEAKKQGVKVILSTHLNLVKPDYAQIHKYEMRVKELGADFLKVVLVVNHKEDVHYGLNLLGRAEVPIILLGTGAYGKESRYIFAQEGSEAIYGHLGQPVEEAQPSMYEISQNIIKRHKRVYIVWKYTDDSENYWPLGLKELVDVYENKEEAVARVKREKDNIKWDVMGMLHVMYNDDALKITEKEKLYRTYIYAIEGKYGDITVELYVEERLVL